MIRLRILTPSSNREHQATAVFLPGAAGAFEVLPSHAPIISALTAGEIRWREPGSELEIHEHEHEEHSLETIIDSFHVMNIKGGIMRLKNDEMTICCEI